MELTQRSGGLAGPLEPLWLIANQCFAKRQLPRRRWSEKQTMGQGDMGLGVGVGEQEEVGPGPRLPTCSREAGWSPWGLHP